MPDPTHSPAPDPAPKRWWNHPVIGTAVAATLYAVAVATRPAADPPPPPPPGRPPVPGLAANYTGRVVPKPAPAVTAEASAQAAAHLGRARELSGRKEHDRAVAELTAALRVRPGYAEAHYERGLAYEATDRPDEALADLTAALQHAPSQPGPRYHRGRVLARLERFPEAVADYTEALRLAAGGEFRPRVLCDRARAHFHNRAYPACVADCTAVLGAVPDAAVAYLLRGQATEAAGSPAAAAADYRAARRLDPELYRAARAEWPTLPESP